MITNIIIFQNFNSKVILKTLNDPLILIRGKSTIAGYNIIISIILLILFLGIYKNQTNLQNYNKKLKVQVNKRTNELHKSLRIVNKKNKELYAISNTDYLTQVRNRRNFFHESEILLSDALLEDKSFSFYNKDVTFVNKIAEEIRNTCNNKKLLIDKKSITFTISIGLRTGDKKMNIDQILNIADGFLYKVKNSGRNRVIRS